MSTRRKIVVVEPGSIITATALEAVLTTANDALTGGFLSDEVVVLQHSNTEGAELVLGLVAATPNYRTWPGVTVSLFKVLDVSDLGPVAIQSAIDTVVDAQEALFHCLRSQTVFQHSIGARGFKTFIALLFTDASPASVI